MKRRYLCLYLPEWSISRATKRHGDDVRVLYKLAVWALRVTPLVALEEEVISAVRAKTLKTLSPLFYGLILDITGTERLYSEKRLANSLFAIFSRRACETRIGIASTIGAAWAFSRFGKEPLSIIPHERSLKEALSPLPPAALRISQQTEEFLTQLGITTLHHLFQLPRPALLARFPNKVTQHNTVVMRIEQALGAREEVPRFIHAPERFQAERHFDIPLTKQESVQQVVLSLFESVFKKLQARGKQASSFVIELLGRNSDRAITRMTKEVALYRATYEYSHIRSVVHPIVEALSVEQGICTVRVGARLLGTISYQQRSFSGAEDRHASVNQLFDHLLVRLGSDRVKKVQFENSYIPERSFSYRSLNALDAQVTSVVQPHRTVRPSYLLEKPEPITAIALLPDRPPSWITWRGAKLRITQGVGPERISAEWWHTPAVEHNPLEDARDYFRVQDQYGRWLWVFRDQRSLAWFIHGAWT